MIEKILATDLYELHITFEFLPKLRCFVFRIEISALEKIKLQPGQISLLYLNLLSTVSDSHIHQENGM